MSDLSPTIPKNPVLKTAEDYYDLRRKGIEYIQKTGSKFWTDYNTHDPGITILETLCYAITDLAYRIGWDIRDILASKLETTLSEQPQVYPNQAFFTARDILTVNATTLDDYRRLLIDLDEVRCAWISCRDCTCGISYYAECNEYSNEQELSYEPLPRKNIISPKGLYDVLLELEEDPELGDLNDSKIEYTASIEPDDIEYTLTLEFRFPDISVFENTQWAGSINSIELSRLGATKTFDLFTDPSLEVDGDPENDELRNAYLRKHWHDVLYLDLKINCDDPGDSFTIKNIAMRIFSDTDAQKYCTAGSFKYLFESSISAMGGAIIERYRTKMEKRKAAIDSAKEMLHASRNLDEDYCCIKTVNIQDVAACASVEVSPDADIEFVQAKIFMEIESYFNPPVPFYSLQELLDTGMPVEDIFNGPKLSNGFIKNDDLENASLKSVLYISDIINKLMDIDGVIAVNNFQLTKYDHEGNVVRGAADPTISEDGSLVFEDTLISASWMLYLTKQNQPRLYQNGSRFIFYKNGLPFYPRMDEANDILIKLHGEAERPKFSNSSANLPVPAGRYRNTDDYYPVQHSLPLTYGIGPEGLPANATDIRKGQAMQLKAYLMVFEQILGNMFTQIAHTADLFSLDPDIDHTYFAKQLNETIIRDYNMIVKNLDSPTLQKMVETGPEFRKRRNRFLDHIMARFGEVFDEYALILTNLEGEQIALDKLINDKIDFINAYPEISCNRAKAFNYKDSLYSTENQPGIKKRISRLLGFYDMDFDYMTITDLGFMMRLKFQLLDNGEPIFTGFFRLPDKKREEAMLYGRYIVMRNLSSTEKYMITEKRIDYAPDKFALRLKNDVNKLHGDYLENFDTQTDAELIRDKLIAWSACTRMIVVEHILLRPKFMGDTLFPGYCCDDEDYYSFRLTFVMPGWVEPFKTNMSMRDFAERTIRQETPSHLLAKICWVDENQFDAFEEAWYNWLEANAAIDWTEECLHEKVKAILENNLSSIKNTEQSIEEVLCSAATSILTECATKFEEFMDKRSPGDNFHISAVTLCSNIEFKDNNPAHVKAIIINLLNNHYNKYIEVSSRLRVVVDLLSKLRNIYPAATIHDWDEGNDQNPIRLGKTALADDGGGASDET